MAIDSTAQRLMPHLRRVALSRDTGIGDGLDRPLVGLRSGGKPDEHLLDALCLVTLARFPSKTERKLIGVKCQADRQAAWGAVLRAIASTPEAKAHAEGFSKRGAR